MSEKRAAQITTTDLFLVCERVTQGSQSISNIGRVRRLKKYIFVSTYILSSRLYHTFHVKQCTYSSDIRVFLPSSSSSSWTNGSMPNSLGITLSTSKMDCNRLSCSIWHFYSRHQNQKLANNKRHNEIYYIRLVYFRFKHLCLFSFELSHS